MDDNPNSNEFADLFHVDCNIEDKYYDEDLQRFPEVKRQTEAFNYEEQFATDKKGSAPLINELQSTDKIHVSPAPPKDAVGFLRLSKPSQPEDLAPTTVTVANQINNGIKNRY